MFALGAIVGSFLNVCIYRLPRGESIVWPASHCPICGNKLKPIELVPIISYFLLKGKCSACGAPISWRYPLVELLTGVLFVVAYNLLPSAFLPLAFCLVFLCLLTVIFFIDLDHQVIPDSLTFLGLVAGLFYGWLYGQLILALLGGALGFAVLLSIAKLGRWLYKKEAVGEGDLLLAGMLGVWLGERTLLAIFLAYLTAGVTVTFLLLLKRVKFGEYLPFGPFLVLGGMIAFFWGAQLVGWYLNLFL